MDFLSANPFDLAIYVCLFAAVVLGFMTGFLRSLATIFGYLCGMGVAVAAAPRLAPLLTTYLKMPTPQVWLVFLAVFVAAGATISEPERFTQARDRRNKSLPLVRGRRVATLERLQCRS